MHLKLGKMYIVNHHIPPWCCSSLTDSCVNDVVVPLSVEVAPRMMAGVLSFSPESPSVKIRALTGSGCVVFFTLTVRSLSYYFLRVAQ